MYGIHAKIMYPGTSLIESVFFFQFRKEEPSLDELDAVRKRLVSRHPEMEEVIFVEKSEPDIVELYQEGLIPGVEELYLDPEAIYIPEWKDETQEKSNEELY